MLREYSGRCVAVEDSVMRLRPIGREPRSGSADPAEERLLTLLQIVNESMYVAEQHHGLLLFLGSATLALLLTLVSSTTDLNPRYGMGVAAAIIFVGLLLSAASFFPRSRAAGRIAGGFGDPDPTDDLYDSKHLARYEPDDLVRGLEESYLEIPVDEIRVTRGKRDLACRVIANSRTTEIKIRLFEYSLLVLAAGGAVALASALAALVG
jgi:hypothetical protein